MCAVDEDLSPGQDHIYVVFLLPVLEPGRHRGRGAWGADAAAASLMGLSGHSYAAKGTPPTCLAKANSCPFPHQIALRWALLRQVQASRNLSGHVHAFCQSWLHPCSHTTRMQPPAAQCARELCGESELQTCMHVIRPVVAQTNELWSLNNRFPQFRTGALNACAARQAPPGASGCSASA